MSPLQKRFSLLLSFLSVLALIIAAALFYGWREMRGSLAQLEGERALPGLTAPVKIERDALGTPTLTGATRTDVARASGFVHAQDRFFQMDLLRRRGAGELAELFGPAALDLDKAARLHGFRRLAAQVLAQLSAPERELLQAYTAGVNTGLATLGNTPWEYLVLRAPPQPWREEDSLLCVYAMWFDLQDSTGSFELNRDAVRLTLGQGTLDFLAPHGNSWDATFDDSKFAPPALPTLRFAPAETAGKVGAVATPPPAYRPEPESRLIPGSNAFALAGRHTATGSALLANDMHLNLAVPHIWYRSMLKWSDGQGAHRVVGVMLPGMPLVVAGSNGHIAWGFTNSYVDTTDVIYAEADGIANIKYRTPQGWAAIQDRTEEIKVKGEPSVSLITRWTEWGPIMGELTDNRYPVLRWTAHNPEATNLRLLELESATEAAQAITIAHRTGLPNQNIIIADAAGHIAWTIAGLIPRRIGYDGRLPVSWAFGDRRWEGWLNAEEIPVVLDPADGLLWNSNNRSLGGNTYELLGDSGYDTGARAGQIRDDLRTLVAAGKKAAPADLHAVQLDDRALFLERWQKFLLETLTDEALKQNPARARLREVVHQWAGHASTDSAAYRIVKAFRGHVAERTLAPFAEQAATRYAAFSYAAFPYEDALWQLVHDQPARLLNPENTTWNSLLLAAADDVLTDADKAGVSPAKFTWGRRNTLAMQHPFSRFMPRPLARLLDMPAVPLPGDTDIPRVQGPAFGQSERLVVAPGHEEEGILTLPGGQSGHPLSPYYQAGHDAWVQGTATPLLPGAAEHTLVLKP
jgi:penicillin amidase